MSEQSVVASAPHDAETMKIGLLMESAQAHQKLAESQLLELRAHAEDLDNVVREEIRRTLVDELRAVTAESARAAGAMRALKGAVALRSVVWNIGIAMTCATIPTAIARWVLPSEAQVAALREQRDSLARSVGHLRQQGGGADWRSCGAAARLCVRVDLKAPVYGEGADYFVVKVLDP